MNAAEFELLTGRPLVGFAYQCHAASHALVKTRWLEGARVARGTHPKVRGQHSWVVIGHPYAPDRVFDPTLWSYEGRDPDVLETDVESFMSVWRPHGLGSIYEWGRPREPNTTIIELTPTTPLSDTARAFLDMCGPLDLIGWMDLANSPMQGWPSREIIEAMLDTPKLRALPPIDIVGMLTDRNPGGMYLP